MTEPAPKLPAQAGPGYILERLLAGESSFEAGDLELRLASAFGFCQGVRSAVAQATAAAQSAAMLSKTCADAPRLYMTGEIIHNPSINSGLRASGVILLPFGMPGRFTNVRPCDQVIIPAFGIELPADNELRAIGCKLIDTTCGWVRRVWKTVAEFSAQGLTIVIHGKFDHEETRATASRAGGPWLVVRGRQEAEALASILLVAHGEEGGPGAGNNAMAEAARSMFGRVFADKSSPGFDPTRDLSRLGLVNQTTMPGSETHAVAEILRRAMRSRLAREPEALEFRSLDTFCTATEERQEAVLALLEDDAVGATIVVGGFRSSNTSHLAELAARKRPAFHVEGAACLVSRDEIRHLPPGATAPIVTRDWFPQLPATIGISSGASTPDHETAEIISRLLTLGAGARANCQSGRSLGACE